MYSTSSQLFPMVPGARCQHRSRAARALWLTAPVLLTVAGCANTTPTASTTSPAPTAPANSAWVAIVNGKETSPQAALGDPATITKILDEGKNRNQVMTHLEYLTKKIGPRLTGSSRALAANEWCRTQYAAWGLADPHLEQWGEIPVGFDRGPSTGKFLLREEKKSDDGTTATEYRPVREPEFTTLSWSPGTAGAVRAPVIRMPKTGDEWLAVKDKLVGAWVLLPAPPALGQRGIRGGMGAAYMMRAGARKKLAEGKTLDDLTIDERVATLNVAGYISTSRDERVWTGALPEWNKLTMDTLPVETQVQVRLSDYDYINSRLADGEPIEAEFNLQHTFNKGPVPTFNTIAEIRGTEKPDEYVIISAHLDSWDGPGSEGCTDNGTGSSVTLEAARILAAVGAKPKRTIRFINWTGEEQGLLGSKGYLEKHKEILPNISAVFVDDGGTNYEGGLVAIDSMVPYLAAATAPVNNQFTDSVDGKPLNVNVHTVDRMPRGGGSDHATFNAAGVPGFFWDEVGRADYGFGWHTQNDKLNLAIPEYLKQSSTCVAITAYQLACAPDLLPREPAHDENDKSTGADGNGADRPRRRRDSGQ